VRSSGSLPALRLSLPPDAADPAGSPAGRFLTFDPDQDDVVEHRQAAGPLLVVGSPGTGKTTALVEAAARRVERDGVAPGSVLLLAPTRTAAARLRQALSHRLGRTVREPLARTPYAYAFGLLRRARVVEGAAVPRLLSGPEQDRVLADLLAGHLLGEGRVPGWPADLPENVRELDGFREELRALIMRAVERGVAPRELARLGRAHHRPAWVAAAEVLDEYLDVTALASPGAFDPAGIVDAAAGLLEGDATVSRDERDRIAFVAVDDAHELSAASYRLLAALCGGGGALLMAGDPDAGTDTFRGAQPHALASVTSRFRRVDGGEGRTVVLRTVHRHGPQLRAVVSRVADGIGSAGFVRHRRAVSGCESGPDPSGDVGGDAGGDVGGATADPEVALLATPAQEAAFIAHRLREAHLKGGIDWGAMAVVLRSARDTSALRRALGAQGIPLDSGPTTLALRDEPGVVPLRLALRCVLRPETLDADTAVALLCGVLGGTDAIGLRRLRRRLVQAFPGGDADVTLAEAISHVVEGLLLDDEPVDPDGAEPVIADGVPEALSGAVGTPVRRVARVLAAGRIAAAEPGSDPERVLWAIWEASGLAQAWRNSALLGGTTGARADRDLDSVMALFTAAARFVERSPHAGAEAFLAELEGHRVPADSLADRAVTGGAVTVTTPHGAVGREWDLVVVAGVQEGVWPDLRPRTSLLGAQDLADLLDGRGGVGDRSLSGHEAERERRRGVLSDELRLFHVAVSRARRRLLVTAVRSEDLLPSSFFDLVLSEHAAAETTALTVVPRAMNLSALVAQLRSVVTDPAAGDQWRRDAASGLARLAAAGVPGADPDDWYGLAGASSREPLRGDQALIAISPSKVEGFQRCPLRWLLEQSGGTRASSTSQALGSLIHGIADAEPAGRPEELRRLLDERWASLRLPDGWPAQALRRRAERALDKFAVYVRESRREGRELVGTEVAVGTQLGRAVVKGTVDRLERRPDGSLYVVDLKTGTTAPPKAEVPRHAQLGVYQAVLDAGGSLAGTHSGGAALVQLGTKTKSTSVQAQPPLAHDENPHWARELVEDTAEAMAGNDFPATSNTMCRLCDLRRCCPAQVEGRRVVT
jgi:superfamily I DNA/RNA helicase/RecB family exonuclease